MPDRIKPGSAWIFQRPELNRRALTEYTFPDGISKFRFTPFVYHPTGAARFFVFSNGKLIKDIPLTGKMQTRQVILNLKGCKTLRIETDIAGTADDSWCVWLSPDVFGGIPTESFASPAPANAPPGTADARVENPLPYPRRRRGDALPRYARLWLTPLPVSGLSEDASATHLDGRGDERGPVGSLGGGDSPGQNTD